MALALAVGAAPWLLTSPASGLPPATLTYTFDSLTASDIDGQDNWVTVDSANNPAGVTHKIGTLSNTSVATENTTKALYFDWEGPGYGSRSTRIDNNDFSTMPIPNSGVAVVEFDMHRAYWGSQFRMGTDTNNDGDLANTELGLRIQLRQVGSTWKTQLTLGTQVHESTAPLGNYATYQLAIDRTLGTASLWHKNRSASADWEVIPGLSNVATGFTTDSTFNNPRTWNGFGVHGEGRTSVFDNLSFRLVDISTRTLSFPATQRGGDRQMTVNVDGLYVTQPLTATVTGDFRFDNGTQSTQVAPGNQLEVTYSPTSHGEHTGTVTLSSTEMLAPLSIALTGRTSPEIVSFSTTAANGTYTTGQTIPIVATTSVDIAAGSTMTATLDTGAVVTLTAASQGRTLSGVYTVSAGQSSPDLDVVSLNASSVVDLVGNAVTSTTLPSGADSLSGAHDVVVAAPNPATSTQLTTTTTTSTTVTAAVPSAVAPTAGGGTALATKDTVARPVVATGNNTRLAPVSSTTVPVASTTTSQPPLPDAVPGEVVALVGGQPVDGTVSNDDGVVIIDIADIEVRVRSTRSDGSVILPSDDGGVRFEPGSRMAITVTGFLGDSDVDIEMRSTPTQLGTLRTDPTGAASREFDVPDSLTVGNHRLVVSGSDQAGQAVTVGLGVALRPADDPAPVGLIVGVVIVAGLAAIVVPAEAVRRRRRMR